MLRNDTILVEKARQRVLGLSGYQRSFRGLDKPTGQPARSNEASRVEREINLDLVHSSSLRGALYRLEQGIRPSFNRRLYLWLRDHLGIKTQRGSYKK